MTLEWFDRQSSEHGNVSKALRCGVQGLNEKELTGWVQTVGRRINNAVDLPMLNEDQEEAGSHTRPLPVCS